MLRGRARCSEDKSRQEKSFQGDFFHRRNPFDASPLARVGVRVEKRGERQRLAPCPACPGKKRGEPRPVEGGESCLRRTEGGKGGRKERAAKGNRRFCRRASRRWGGGSCRRGRRAW